MSQICYWQINPQELLIRKQVNLYNGKPYTKNSVAFVLSGSGESVDISKITESDNIEKCIILKLESQNGRYEVMYSGEKYLNLNTAKDIDFCSGENLVIRGADTDLKEGEILSIEGIDLCVTVKDNGMDIKRIELSEAQLYSLY